MRRHPIFSAPKAAKGSGLAAPTVTSCIETRKRLRLVREVKRTKRPRLYAYQPYIELLSEQTAGEA